MQTDQVALGTGYGAIGATPDQQEAPSSCRQGVREWVGRGLKTLATGAVYSIPGMFAEWGPNSRCWYYADCADKTYIIATGLIGLGTAFATDLFLSETENGLRITVLTASAILALGAPAAVAVFIPATTSSVLVGGAAVVGLATVAGSAFLERHRFRSLCPRREATYHS